MQHRVHAVITLSFPGYSCHCGSLTDSGCVNGECQANLFSGGCNIHWQAGNTNQLFFTCDESIFHPSLCSGNIQYSNGSSVPFRMCCRENLCNSMENFEEKLRESNYQIPWVVTTTSDIATSSSIPSQSNSSTILSTTNLAATLSPSTVAVTIASMTTTSSLRHTTTATLELPSSTTRLGMYL